MIEPVKYERRAQTVFATDRSGFPGDKRDCFVAIACSGEVDVSLREANVLLLL